MQERVEFIGSNGRPTKPPPVDKKIIAAKILKQADPVNAFLGAAPEFQVAVMPMLICLMVLTFAGIRRLLSRDYRIGARLNRIVSGVAIIGAPLVTVYIIQKTVFGMRAEQFQSLTVWVPNAIKCIYVLLLGILLWASSRFLSQKTHRF